MKRLLLALTAAMLLTGAADAQNIGLFHRKAAIETLQKRIDSLQQAYDALYNDYQALIEPVNDADGDILIDDEMPSMANHSADDIDSLLNLYYIQKQMDINDFDMASIERDSLTSNIPDSVYIARLKRLNSYIPIEFNQIVKNCIIRYTERITASTSRMLGLAPYYLPMIEETLDEFDMPKELKAMAVIESAFNPRAVSRARAKGMWQFMYSSAKRYGLEMTSYVDERYDPQASCRAAVRYLKDNYGIFGDWGLTIASYNCGEGNVMKAVRRSGGKTNFWDIYQYLPRETRGYVPIFIAALYVLTYYPEHGLVPAPVNLPAMIDTFQINRNVHFEQIADNIGISVDMLRDLNPKYLHDIIPGEEHTYVLNLPHAFAASFIDKEQEIYKYKDSVYFNPVNTKKIKESINNEGQRIVHKVKSGENLGGIARRYGVTVANLKKWNNLRSNNIRVGQRLYIYGKGGGSSASASAGSKSTATPKANTTNAGGYITYTVKRGDTLYEIAKANGVTLNDLYKLNNMTKNSKIYPGMKIRVKKAQ